MSSIMKLKLHMLNFRLRKHQRLLHHPHLLLLARKTKWSPLIRLWKKNPGCQKMIAKSQWKKKVQRQFLKQKEVSFYLGKKMMFWLVRWLETSSETCSLDLNLLSMGFGLWKVEFQISVESLEKEKQNIHANPPRQRGNRSASVSRIAASTLTRTGMKTPSIFKNVPNSNPSFKNYEGDMVLVSKEL